MNFLFLLLAGAGVYLAFRMLLGAKPGIPPSEAKAALDAGTAVLIDIREPDEWAGGVAKGAVLLPFSDLGGNRKSWRPFLEKNKGRKLLLYCASGTRSGMAVRLLSGEGFDTVNAGGIGAWIRAGWPVTPPNRGS